MREELRYTLVCDGTSDRALVPILTWLLRQHLPDCAIEARWVATKLTRLQPSGLVEKISAAITAYPCDLLFVHRDAEKEPPDNRVKEIDSALTAIPGCKDLPAVCVVPVRMTEAWLLFNEPAIRLDADNANGRAPLFLPKNDRAEEDADPKETLIHCLRTAKDAGRRRQKQFDVNYAKARVAELIAIPPPQSSVQPGFAPLRALSAFQTLETDLKKVVERNEWNRDN